LRWQAGKWERVVDEVAQEVGWRLLVDGRLLAEVPGSPWDPPELAVGYLYSVGLIDEARDVQELQVDEARGEISVVVAKVAERLRTWRARGASPGGPNGELLGGDIHWEGQITPRDVLAATRMLRSAGIHHRRTGATHAALLQWEGRTEVAEDVSRYSAVDRVIGRWLLSGEGRQPRLMAVTGRVGRGMVLRAARVRCPILISRAAPLSAGLRLAEEMGICVIAFARARRFSVYTVPERVTTGW